MNKLQNDRKSRLKLSRNRYEKFVKDGKIYRYDRLNHRVSADSESSVPAEKNRAHVFAVYPHRLLNRVKIPHAILRFWLVGSTIMFFWSICMFALFRADVKALFFQTRIADILCIPAIIALSVIAHEFSHAVFAVSSGGFVGEIAAERIGHSLKFATKTVWLKENKTRKIEFYYAGIAMNMFLCGFSAFLFCFCEHVLTVFGFAANLVFVLMNSFPCDGSDGLKMLDMFLKRK